MKTLKEIYEYRQMIFSLVRKELRGRYKGSVLGFLWTFINPLLQLLVYTLVFSVILKSNIEKYYLFLFVALVPWNFFSACLTGGSSSVINEKEMVKKIYFPRQVLPIAYVTTAFVNMLLCFIVVFGVIIVSGEGINPVALLYLPIFLIVEYILGLGIALISSALDVYFRDLEYILGVIAMAWTYLTPVMYSIDIVPDKLMSIFMLNPMTPIIVGCRDILYYRQIPQVSTLLNALLMGIAFVIIGSIVFKKCERHFVEEM